jgi:hypothetical protein
VAVDQDVAKGDDLRLLRNVRSAAWVHLRQAPDCLAAVLEVASHALTPALLDFC